MLLFVCLSLTAAYVLPLVFIVAACFVFVVRLFVVSLLFVCCRLLLSVVCCSFVCLFVCLLLLSVVAVGCVLFVRCLFVFGWCRLRLDG